MIIHDHEQYSDEYWRVRRGVPSASNFKRIMTPKTMKLAAGRDEYVNELIADMLRDDYGAQVDEYASAAMIKGQKLEPAARDYYSLITDAKPRQVGYCLSEIDGRPIGGSPDALVGDDGGLECKSPDAKTHVGYLRYPESLLAEYACQVHGYLIITGRSWWDLMSFCEGGFPEVLIRVKPDAYTDALRACLTTFVGEYQAAWEKIKAMMPPEPEISAEDEEDAMLSMFAGSKGKP